ncbi:MAG: hypothetical protein E6600_04475 [Anaerocolumna aminovalerica]|uniref:hypothetical protein n=1 Tax=Anaerocolumna aminovalerica TaxID=1527 RepID=UPI00291487A4|nr:hypothetical protein [Anaerocolumna aminovalerica]MDU6263737.1 hypothetical protein [Anaerocolumna aminovalerica]
MLTTRDVEIKDFLDNYKVATTSTIAHFFFPSQWAAYKRLKYLVDHKQIKRIRDSINNEYMYFAKRPKQLRHSLLVTEFYREFSNQYQVVNFKIEPVLRNIRPDAVFGYVKNGKNYIGLLEVEISNKGFNFNKYEKFYSSYEYKNYFPVMPNIFIVTDKNITRINNNIKYKIIKTEKYSLRIPK